jgi:hypothetical protein
VLVSFGNWEFLLPIIILASRIRYVKYLTNKMPVSNSPNAHSFQVYPHTQKTGNAAIAHPQQPADGGQHLHALRLTGSIDPHWVMPKGPTAKVFMIRNDILH